MNEMIYEDDPEMGILYDIKTYLDNPPHDMVGKQFTIDFIDGIEKQLKKISKITMKQYEILKQIHNRLGLSVEYVE
jgi:hypothetical protein